MRFPQRFARRCYARRSWRRRWFHRSDRRKQEVRDLRAPAIDREIAVALLTGGGDRPYAFGLATALISKGAALDLVGSDDLDGPEFRGNPRVNFLNLRGNQRPDVSFPTKVFRV